jgi:hypothetical protein
MYFVCIVNLSLYQQKRKDMTTLETIYGLFASNYAIAQKRNLTPQDLSNVNLQLLIQVGVSREAAEVIVTDWMNECKNNGLFHKKS